MRRYIMLISAALFAFASCNKEEVTTVATSDGQVTARLQLSVEDAMASRTGGDSYRYVAEAYSDNTYTTPAKVFANGSASHAESTSSSLEILINTTKDYYFLLWADSGEDCYDASSLWGVKLATSATEFTEAWRGTFSIIKGDASSYETTLSRAVARVAFVETDTFAGTLKVEYGGYPEFNVAFGRTGGDLESRTKEYTFESTTKAVLNESAPLYAFAPVGFAVLSDFKFTANSGSVFTVPDVPFHANYITSVIGAYAAGGEGSHEVGKDVEVEIEDSALRIAILTALGKGASEKIYQEDTALLTSLNVNDAGISSMKGIENFTNLETLLCSGANNTFTSIDISAFENLKVFNCNSNTALSEIIFSDKPEVLAKMESLVVYKTAITKLDLTQMTGLTLVMGYDCLGLTTLDLRNCTNIPSYTGTTKGPFFARCYNMETVYITEAQTQLKFNFKQYNNDPSLETDETHGVKFLVGTADQTDNFTEYSYGDTENLKFDW